MEASSDNSKIAKIVYVLYVVNLLLGVTALVGIIVAYIYRGSSSAMVAEHFRYQIRTFWMGLLYSVIAGLTWTIMIGWLVLIFYVIWLIIRSVKGFKALAENKAPDNVDSWLF
ncbi:DUF4870 family protein [Paraferrimonas haliotis]|uniref:DUF4870 family protein n=1 Tax=Paraferrimonas haliotis TaxID=2013866 RepID=UPI000BA92937|nr:hypothetical protein [Paraferrimonas haliotis]